MKKIILFFVIAVISTMMALSGYGESRRPIIGTAFFDSTSKPESYASVLLSEQLGDMYEEIYKVENLSTLYEQDKNLLDEGINGDAYASAAAKKMNADYVLLMAIKREYSYGPYKKISMSYRMIRSDGKLLDHGSFEVNIPEGTPKKELKNTVEAGIHSLYPIIDRDIGI